MVFIKVLMFIAIANAIPLVMMWSAGAFVGQEKPSPVITQLVRFAVSGMLFFSMGGAAFYVFKQYETEWWQIPLAAIIAGVGISGIIGVNTYSRQRDESTEANSATN